MKETQIQLVGSLIQRGFGGSARDLVLRAAAAEGISAAQLAQIKRMLDKAKGK